MIPEKDKDTLEDTLDMIIGNCRLRCPSGNYARLCAEEQVHGMLMVYRHFNPKMDDDFSVTKIEDVFMKRIAKEMNF